MGKKYYTKSNSHAYLWKVRSSMGEEVTANGLPLTSRMERGFFFVFTQDEGLDLTSCCGVRSDSSSFGGV